MKCQSLFLEKKKKLYIKVSSAAFVQRVVKINPKKGGIFFSNKP